MKKVFALSFILIFGLFYFVQAEEVEINFFYSNACPNCAAEEKFLNTIEEKYPDVKINRYLYEDNVELLKEFCLDYDAEKYFGLVPMTFIQDKFILGFDNPENIGKQIEQAILGEYQENQNINLPFIGQIDMSSYSLPVLAALMGGLDGFNVCSLGALMLILGLVLVFKSKRKVLILGGSFLLTTAIVYGFLIFLWYQVFSLLSPYTKVVQILVGVLAVFGGLYFFKQFLKSRKNKQTCSIGESKISLKISKKLEESFKKPKGIVLLIGSCFLFAVAITVIEFPCSAVVPVIFAGVLSAQNLSLLSYISYMAIFIFFYLLDEIIIFLVAVFTMKIWITSPKFTTWLNLFGAILLFFFGLYYILNLF